MENRNFKKMHSQMKIFRDRYLYTLAAHKIFTHLNRKIRVKKNQKVLEKYPYFFITTKEATRHFVLIRLACLFDDDQKALSINWALGYLTQNRKKFNRKEFENFHKEREILPEIFEGYKGMTAVDLQRFKKRLNKNKDRITRLWKYRSKYLTHDDRKKVQIKFDARDVNVLLRLVKDFVTFLYEKLDFSSNVYKNFSEEPTRNIDALLDALFKYERQRLIELRGKYIVAK